jgi:uncharacterized repeat protein (TIGR03803 family)
MKIRSGRDCAFMLVFLVGCSPFVVRASAQGHVTGSAESPKTLNAAAESVRRSRDMAPASSAQKVLYNFCSASACGDGVFPNSGLVQDAAGNLYGTVVNGGIFTVVCSGGGCGTVFKIDTSNHFSVLYSFCSVTNCTDGVNPQAGLILDSAGSLYGTTSGGGANGGGTVFKLDTNGVETVLYSFCSVALCTDGSTPVAGVIQDAAGNLYGTTYVGGANGGGVVFKVDTTGQETVLYSFCSVIKNLACADGQWPAAGLIQDAAGNLYGTTTGGGSRHILNGLGWGTVFKLDSAGHETVLYNFCSATSCTDGSVPKAGLIQDATGNFYGTTSAGGANTTADLGAGGGTVFKLDTSNHETVLYSFCSAANCADGESPAAGLIQDSAGNLYGTTVNGGTSTSSCLGGSCGTVFKLDNTNLQTVIYNFCSVSTCTDGEFPFSGLIEDSSGNLYGTTQGGGLTGGGTVFKLATRTTPTITLTSSANPSYVDQSVTFTATVTGSGVTPTGSVTFEENQTAVGTVNLSGGQAAFPITFTQRGTLPINASYSGDLNYNPVNSAVLKQAVTQYTSTTSLVSNLNPSVFGQTVTLTATVTSGGLTPTGKVYFKNGTTTIGSGTLSGGVAAMTTSTLAPGSYAMTATYSGDTEHATSVSAALTQGVNDATSATALTSSANPAKSGHTVKFTATVTCSTAKATGTVTFKDGSTTLGTGTIGNGTANFNTSALSVGSHNITAVYGGNADITGSTSTVLVQVVD